MSNITWLHLSDLHCSQSKRHDIDKVLTALWEDLKYLADEEGLSPDFILFTGDIAQGGKAKEYELATDVFFDPLLAATQLSRELLFVVPGNHDVDWSKVDPMVARGMAELLTDRNESNRFLSPDHDRTFHFLKFDGYANFCNLYFEEREFSARNYYYTHTFTVADVTISLLGLNSVWMSATNRDGTKVMDQGHLLLGEQQLDAVLEGTKNSDLRLALMHHPLDWLHESERGWAKRRLNAECHFILHGHLHETEVEIRRALSGSSVFIPTGALYAHREFPNAYNLVHFNTQTRRGTIYLRRYVNEGPTGDPVWIKDLASTGNSLDGKFPFELLDCTPSLEIIDPKYSKRILFVEDDEGWRQVMRSILYPPDFDLQFANSAESARHILNEDFDLLILNLCLRGDRDYEGEMLLESLCADGDSCKIPCIVLTGYVDSTRGLYERYGVFEVFLKSDRDRFNRKRFSRVVRDAIDMQ
jgi:CheY-like chemotaxis protein